MELSPCEGKRVVQSELKDALETASADDQAAWAEIKESRPVKQKTLGMPFTLFMITETIDTLIRMRYRLEDPSCIPRHTQRLLFSSFCPRVPARISEQQCCMDRARSCQFGTGETWGSWNMRGPSSTNLGSWTPRLVAFPTWWTTSCSSEDAMRANKRH